MFTLFVDVPFHRTLKTPFYMYLLFVVTAFLSYLLLNICIGFLKNWAKLYRELYPLAWKIWRLDSNFDMTVSVNFVLFHPHLPSLVFTLAVRATDTALQTLLVHWEYCQQHTLYAIHRKCVQLFKNAITVRILHDTLEFMFSLHNTGITSLIPLVLLFYLPILATKKRLFLHLRNQRKLIYVLT